ncbi:MAG: hypothetical protein AAB303_06035 [Chloroflexota bacterium]
MSARRLLEVEYSRDEGMVVHVRPRMMRLVPHEARIHWRNAGREYLLAMRSLLDAAIEGMPSEEPGEPGRAGRRRQRVEVKEEKA